MSYLLNKKKKLRQKKKSVVVSHNLSFLISFYVQVITHFSDDYSVFTYTLIIFIIK